MTVIFIIVVNFYPAYQFIYDSSVKIDYIITDNGSLEDDLMQFEELGVKIKIAEWIKIRIKKLIALIIITFCFQRIYGTIVPRRLLSFL